MIVEANCPEYHWCTRFTIYTGLPGVVGWNWHQRQQRTLTPQLVEERVSEIDTFYTTTDVEAAERFLKEYNVKYIIVGTAGTGGISRPRPCKVRAVQRQACGIGLPGGRYGDLSGASMNIIHITTRKAWIDATRAGQYSAPSLEQDGFIHASTLKQVLPVAAKYYKGQPGLCCS